MMRNFLAALWGLTFGSRGFGINAPTRRTSADPAFRDPHHKMRSRVRTKRSKQGPPRLGRPKCEPGSITYHDALVRHLGYDRRKADQMQRAWRDGKLKALPVLQ